MIDEASQETRRKGAKVSVVRVSVGAPETAKNSEGSDNNMIWLPARSTALLAISLAFGGAKVTAQSLGNLAQYPPLPKQLTITTSEDGSPIIEPSVLKLYSGNYYRLTVSCPDVKGDLSGWRLEMPRLLDNSHLRLVSVGDMEIHLQGLSFNAIECDEVGSVNISFVPIKPGSYEFYVGNVPLSVGRPMGDSGLDTQKNAVFGKFLVE